MSNRLVDRNETPLTLSKTQVLMAKAKNRFKLILFGLLALLLLAGVGGFTYWKTRERTITVQSEKATRRNLTELVVANGKIQPVIQVKISPGGQEGCGPGAT